MWLQNLPHGVSVASRGYPCPEVPYRTPAGTGVPPCQDWGTPLKGHETRAWGTPPLC